MFCAIAGIVFFGILLGSIAEAITARAAELHTPREPSWKTLIDNRVGVPPHWSSPC